MIHSFGPTDVVTYDGLRFSCQMQGDHILATSLDSGFELQGKFQEPVDTSIMGSATVLTGFHLRTGRPGEPDIEFDIVKDWRRALTTVGASNSSTPR